jgi:hypothetical protein
LVASHADAINKKKIETAKPLTANAPKPAKPKNGYIVVYSEVGVYNAVKIVGAGLTTTPLHKCGSTTYTSPSATYTKAWAANNRATPAASPIACTPIGGAEAYHVYFAASRADLAKATSFVSVDVNAGVCTLVHANPALTRQIPAVGSTCPGSAQEPDIPTKVNVTMRVLPQLSGNKKNAKGYVEISTPGTDLTELQCSGQVTMSYSLNGSNKGTLTMPLKYVRASSSTSNSYCVAKFLALSSKNLSSGNYTLTAIEAGTPYFNPVSATGTVSVPAPPAKKTTSSSKSSSSKQPEVIVSAPN